jgi:hypothetical protein
LIKAAEAGHDPFARSGHGLHKFFYINSKRRYVENSPAVQAIEAMA